MIWTAPPDRAPDARQPLGLHRFTLNELLNWILLIAGAAYWGGVIRTYHHDAAIGVVSVAQSVFSDGAFNVAGCGLIAVWARRIELRDIASRWQIAGALAISLLFAVPTRQTTILGLLAVGAVLTFRSPIHTARPIAALLLGFAGGMIWTSTYLLPLHAATASFDAELCSGFLRMLGEAVQVRANVLENLGAGINVEILAACASSFPLAGVAMAFMVVMAYAHHVPRLADLPWLVAALLASVALTELRLSLMALGDANYLWIHDGEGGTLYALSATALAVLFPVLAMRQSGSVRAFAA